MRTRRGDNGSDVFDVFATAATKCRRGPCTKGFVDQNATAQVHYLNIGTGWRFFSSCNKGGKHAHTLHTHDTRTHVKER